MKPPIVLGMFLATNLVGVFIHSQQNRTLAALIATNALDDNNSPTWDTNKKQNKTKEFSVENLGCDDDNIKADCGNTKCFFPLATNHEFGYIATNSTETEALAVTRAWEIYQYLEQEYGIPPLAIEEPRIVSDISLELATCLNSKRRCINPKQDHNLADFATMVTRQQGIIVQLSRQVKAPAMMFKCQLTFVDDVVGSRVNDAFWEGISNYTTFREVFQSERITAQLLLQREPYLIKDFQLLIDQQGFFHYIDLGHKDSPIDIHSSALEKAMYLQEEPKERERLENCDRAFEAIDRIASNEGDQTQARLELEKQKRRTMKKLKERRRRR